jgi:hypothetical protein
MKGQEARYWMLVAGYSILDAGCSILDAGSLIQRGCRFAKFASAGEHLAAFENTACRTCREMRWVQADALGGSWDDEIHL